MIKISGIIPASSRIKSVDISSAHPVRAGAPDPFKIGSGKEQRDRIAFSESLLEKPDASAATYTSNGKLKTNEFFENRLKSYGDVTSPEETINSEKNSTLAIQSEAPEEFQSLQETQSHEVL